MKKYLFIVFLITISNSLIADTPFSVRRDNVKVFTSPNFENEIPSTEYFYGDTISITLYSDLWAEVILPDGKKGYVKKRTFCQLRTASGLYPRKKKSQRLFTGLPVRQPSLGNRMTVREEFRCNSKNIRYYTMLLRSTTIGCLYRLEAAKQDI